MIIANERFAGGEEADGAGKPKRREFRRISSYELATQNYESEFLVRGVLAANQPCIIAGGEKSLKTTIAIELGVCLATTKPFLGKFAVDRAVSVGIMSGESGLGALQETARRICAAKGMDLATDCGALVWSDELPNFSNLRDQDGIEQFIMDDALEVLIVDPAYLCIDPDGRAGDLFKMGSILLPMTRLCQRMGVTLCILHHNKGVAPDRQFEPAELQDVSWAGFKQFARQWLLLSRRRRYEPGTGEHALWMTVGGSAGHGMLKALDVSEGVWPERYWDIRVHSAAEARDAVKADQAEARQRDRDAGLERDKQAIIQQMVKLQRPETKTVLRQRVGRRGQCFETAFTQLLGEQQIFEWPPVKKANGIAYPSYWHEPPSAWGPEPAVAQDAL